MADTDNKANDETVENAVEDHHHHLKLHSFGHVRLRHEHTNEIILTPTPSLDPNDPLRW
jgi:hypothetical protein